MAIEEGREGLSAQAKKIAEEAKQWVMNATKATTNKRLTILWAMFNFMAKRGKIRKADVPSFPIVAGVDNKKRGFLEKADLPKNSERTVSKSSAYRTIYLRDWDTLRCRYEHHLGNG